MLEVETRGCERLIELNFRAFGICLVCMSFWLALCLYCMVLILFISCAFATVDHSFLY